MKRLTKLQIVLIVLIIANLSFIWIHSTASIPESRGESMGWVAWLNSIQHFIKFTDHVVRKLAHMAEFASLSFWTGWLILSFKEKIKYLILDINICMLVALLDETIQIFSGRGDQISDVWVDTSGAVIGAIVFGIIYCIYKKNRKA